MALIKLNSRAIPDDTVIASDIADGSISTAKIATGAVVADGLGAGAVTNAKLGAGAVTVDKVSGNLGRRNMIINGAMNVSQRGTSITGITSGTNWTADRFGFITATSGGTYTLSKTTTVPSGEGFKHSLKVDCTTAGDYSTAGTVTMIRCSPFEIQDCARLAYGTSGAKKLTVSFWTRASYTGTFTALLVTHDTAQRNIIKKFTISSADTWQKVVLTYDGDTGSTFTGSDNILGLSLDIWMGGGSSYTGGSQSSDVWRARSTHNTSILEGNGTLFGTNTSHDFYITGVQVEQNDTATDFEHRSYAEELALCQRYFETSYVTGVTPGTYPQGTGAVFAVNHNSTSYPSSGELRFTTRKRATPTFVQYNSQTGTVNSVYGQDNGVNTAITSVNTISEVGIGVFYASGGGFSTVGYRYTYHYTADSEL